MGRKERFFEQISLPAEPLPGQPLLELLGDKRMVIEQHKGVIKYDKTSICVAMAYGSVQICGCGLSIVQMTGERLVVSGKIESFSICRKERE